MEDLYSTDETLRSHKMSGERLYRCQSTTPPVTMLYEEFSQVSPCEIFQIYAMIMYSWPLIVRRQDRTYYCTVFIM
jgi:hypothetical protein